MAKRTPRQELRKSKPVAPYRVEQAAEVAPTPVPMAPALVAPVAPVVPVAPAAPVAEAIPAPMTVPHTGPTTFASMPDLLAVAQSALGFASAALAELPPPTEVLHGDPTAAAPPPGKAPAGDARSLRRSDQFVLLYRHGASVISRRGTVGQRGAWRVIDYPGTAPAAHAYALECSRLIEQGFRDVE